MFFLVGARATKFDRQGSIPNRVIPKTGLRSKVPLTYLVLPYEGSRMAPMVPVARKPREYRGPLATLPKERTSGYKRNWTELPGIQHLHEIQKVRILTFTDELSLCHSIAA